MPDDQTLRVYDARVKDYASTFRSDAEKSDTLDEFIAGVGPGARVLDLGCGPGTWARQMLAAGLVVDAIDASEGMVAEAARIDGLTVWRATFDEVDAVDRYDGIWANFSLLHAPKSDMPAHLARLKRALKPGGRLHIGLKEGDGEQRDKIGRFYSYYTVDELSGLLAAFEMPVTDIRQGASAGLDGTVAPWFTLTAHG